MSYDPLSGPSTPSNYRAPSSAAQHGIYSSTSSQTVRSISPLAPRSPLPGEQRGYRPQSLPPPPSASAWGGATSPNTTPTRDALASSSSATAHDSPPLPPPPPSSSHQQQTSPQHHRNGGLQPRGPHASAFDNDRSRGIRHGDDDDDDDDVPAQAAAPKGPPAEPFVRMRIIGLEKNRKDIYIKFNAESNLPSYRHTNYRTISRSYSEFLKFAEALSVTCPQSIIPALPLAQTSAPTDDEDDRLVKYAFQKWVARITSDASIMRDDELRSFIESDFSYTARSRRKTGSSFHFSRGSRLPDEQDDDLTMAKMSMSKLEAQFNETSKAIERVSKARRTTAQAYAEVGDHLSNFATTETYTPLANGIKRLARSTKVHADLLAIQAASEQVTLGDALAYQSMNAHSAKETLSARDAIVEEHRTAMKSTISRRRNIEKLKSSANIKADRVDEALDELDEAKRHEKLLEERLSAISHHLQPSLQAHSRAAHHDILSTLLDHARASLLHEKQLLKELETLRPELHGIKKPTAGVYYHTPGVGGSPTPNPRGPPQPIGAPQSPTMARNNSAGSAHASPLTTGGRGGRPDNDGTRSMFVGRTVSSGFGSEERDQSQPPPHNASMAQPAQKRTVRSMASSVVVANEGRQKVDARMAASMLANGF